ncbi:MAG TPA: PrsW family glutamic-type intramembrane protease [Anaerolineae bacterium]|nr:PrsW family glutamic-type intramembrane protease [Anaerolineae bacterium]
MSDPICCVCQEPAGPSAKELGGRWYCAAHYERATKDRRGLWQAGVAQIVGLLALVGLVELLVALVHPQLEGVWLMVASVVMALVPALVWLSFFYQQDRLEPEPKGYLLGVFLLGGLLAMAVALPLTRDVFHTASWLGMSPLVNIAGSILVVGAIHEFLKYAAVRYFVYPMAEFDERIDGIVYGTAAGLGFATALNIEYVLRSGGVDLQAGIISVVVVALAQASFAGVTGYFLGRAKFEHRPIWWMPAGLALASALNGLFTYLRGEVTRGGISLTAGGGHNPWPGLILATVVAVAVFATLSILMRRANQKALAQTAGGAQ